MLQFHRIVGVIYDVLVSSEACQARAFTSHRQLNE